MPAAGMNVQKRLLLGAVISVAVLLPLRRNVRHLWSYLVHCVGYRMLSVHLSCHSLAVSAVPLVARCAM
jgi:hypothetical protein